MRYMYTRYILWDKGFTEKLSISSGIAIKKQKKNLNLISRLSGNCVYKWLKLNLTCREMKYEKLKKSDTDKNCTGVFKCGYHYPMRICYMNVKSLAQSLRVFWNI